MVANTPEAVRAPQEEVVVETGEVQIPDEIQKKIDKTLEKYKSKLKGMAEAYQNRLMSEAELEIGGTTPSGYQYWNCLSSGPYTFSATPPFGPNKIVAHDEFYCYMLGVIWINPSPGPGGSLSGTQVLGGRDIRMRFETMNVTHVTNGPDGTFSISLPSPSPEFIYRWWRVPLPDPRANPCLLEVNLTADVTLGGQPLAAFGTWHFDLDVEPAFWASPSTALPTMSPHVQFERPARFLVYHR